MHPALRDVLENLGSSQQSSPPVQAWPCPHGGGRVTAQGSHLPGAGVTVSQLWSKAGLPTNGQLNKHTKIVFQCVLDF